MGIIRSGYVCSLGFTRQHKTHLSENAHKTPGKTTVNAGKHIRPSGVFPCDAVGCRGRRDSHGDGEDIACGGDGHAGAVHHLLTVAVQHTLVRAPGHGQREGDVHLLVRLATWENKQKNNQSVQLEMFSDIDTSPI